MSHALRGNNIDHATYAFLDLYGASIRIQLGICAIIIITVVLHVPVYYIIVLLVMPVPHFIQGRHNCKDP
jgi:hypothetical protein